MVTRPFELRELFLAVDVERKQQGLSWVALADQVGVAASTVRRFAEAEDAEADGVLALVRWLGTVPEDYVAGGAVRGVQLPVGDGGYIRVDMELVAMANGDPDGAKGRVRTSIQKLVAAAQRSRQPVSSLTRFSEV